MLEAAGGGGGGTDWWGMSMELLHSVSQNPDIDAQYQIVDGWQKSAELIADHMSQVQDYRDALATAWPPTKSSAAATYLARLDGLLKNLNETYEAALANRDALSSASLSLSLAKTEVAKIYGQWDTNNKALAAFNQQQAQNKQPADSSKPTPSPSPSGEEPPPVTASQQEALRRKAITLMSGVSSDLAEAQLKVVTPAPYTPETAFNKATEQAGAGTTNVPVLPPIVPTSYSAGSGSASPGGSSSLQRSSTFPSASGGTLPATGPAVPSAGNPGLVLGGANPPSTTLNPPSAGPSPITSLPSSAGPITGTGVLPPATGPFAPNVIEPNTTGGAFRPLGGMPEGGLKAMPPGGIIGKGPTAGLGEPDAARFGTQRVNPVGGVIGEPGTGIAAGRGVGGLNGARSGMRSAASEQPYGQLGGRRAGRRDQSGDRRWDPDNPWMTEEGVDPVVLPALEQCIDPGPAIGLG